MKKSQKKLFRVLSFVSGTLLVVQSFLPGFIAIQKLNADEEPTPTQEQSAPTQEPTVEPTTVPTTTTIEATSTPTPEQTPAIATEPTATPTPDTTETPTPETNPTDQSKNDEEPPKETGPPKEDGQLLDGASTTAETSATPVPTPEVKDEKECTQASDMKDTLESDWKKSGETSTFETNDAVTLGVKYVFPANTQVSVTFTCLPKATEKRTSLKIQEVNVSDLKLPDGVNAGDKAYDITTGMENGTFEYTVTLPKPEGKTADVSYIEKSVTEAKDTQLTADDIKPVEESKVNQEGNTVKVTNLDHFTIFIVVAPDETINDNSVANQDNAWVSDNAYAEFNSSSDTAEYGFPNLGISSGATIEGIEVLVEGKTTGRDLDVSIWNKSNSSPDAYTSSKTADLNGTDAVVLVGGNTDKWGKTWTVSDFNTDFKVFVDATSGGGTAFLDQIRVKVYYSEPLTPPTLPNNPSDDYALTSVTGVWTHAFGGSNITGINTNEVRWGNSTGYGQSGLRFDGSGVQTFNEGNTFYLGILTHLNWPITNAATGAKLKITLQFSRPGISPNPEFSYDFTIDETPNSSGNCPAWQQTSTPCDDKITFPTSYGSTSFTIGDKLYTLKINGFVNSYPSGTPVSEFITEEQKNSSAFLVGSLSSVLVEAPQITLVQKAVNGDDADTAPGPSINVGSTANFTYSVQNTGNVALTDITVVDDKGVTVTCPKTTLEPGELMTCTGSTSAVLGLQTNTAHATAKHGGNTYTSNNESANYTGIQANGTLRVIKNVVDASETPLPSSSFSINVKYNGTDITGSPQNGSGTGTVYTLAPGTYQVIEPNSTVSDKIFHLSFSGACTRVAPGSPNYWTAADVTVVAGQEKVCTLTNERPTGIVAVHKEVDTNGDGTFEGDDTVANGLGFRWGFHNGPTDKLMGTSLIWGAAPDSAGPFVIHENTVPGYHYVGWYYSGDTTHNCNNPETYKPLPSMQPSLPTMLGDSFVLCNTRDAGTITLDKITNPSGNLQEFTFHVVQIDNNSWNGATQHFNPLPGGFSQTINVTDLTTPPVITVPTGNYDLYEDAPGGWIQSNYICNYTTGVRSGGGIMNYNFDIRTGENATCTFTNTRTAGKITIVKDTVPNDGQDFSFTTTGGLGSFTLDDDGNNGNTRSNTKVFTNKPDGQYTVTENAVAGWKLTNLVCNDTNGSTNLTSRTATINLEAGEDITCTFTNEKTGSISGYKWNDEDGDGNKDQKYWGCHWIPWWPWISCGWEGINEQKLPGWTIFIDENGDSILNGTEISTTTDSNGDYHFDQLLLGTYSVCEVLQPGWTNTYPSDSLCQTVTLTGGCHDNANFGNKQEPQFGSISGYKWEDLNGNGVWETGDEPVVNGTINPLMIFVDLNSDGDLDPLDNPPEYGASIDSLGRYSFGSLTPGTYNICEKDDQLTGWQRTYPATSNCQSVVVNPGQDTPANFGNQHKQPRLEISKINDATGDKAPGESVNYTITVRALDNQSYNVLMTDLLPVGFVYRPGSWSVKKNGVAVSIPEPTYASPGTWDLGDMAKDDVYELTLTADIASTQKPGIYRDLALSYGCSQGEGDCGVGGADSVLAMAVNPGYVRETFVGTQVSVVKEESPSISVNLTREERTEENKIITEEVLGASTTLPATGAHTKWIFIAVLLLTGGVSLVIVGKRLLRRHYA